MRKSYFITGGVLILLAVLLYAALHDVSRLSFFRFVSSFSPLDFYCEMQQMLLLRLRRLPFFCIVNNFGADFLWVLSLCFWLRGGLSRKTAALLAFLTAFLSEFVQFFSAKWGTADVLDMVVYGCTIFVFFLLDFLLRVE